MSGSKLGVIDRKKYPTTARQRQLADCARDLADMNINHLNNPINTTKQL